MIDISKYKITNFYTLEGNRAINGKTENFDIKTILSSIWSPIIFNGSRCTANFEYCDLFICDIDDGLEILDAGKRLGDLGYAYIIASTRNHQKPKKNLPPCDRYRIILPLKTPITSHRKLQKAFNHVNAILGNNIDKNTEYGSQFYFPCKPTVLWEELDGNAFDWGEDLGWLSNSTLNFLKCGAPDGEKRMHLIKAAHDFKSQGYPKEYFSRIVAFLGEAYSNEDAKEIIEKTWRAKSRYGKRLFNSDDEDKEFPTKVNGFYFETPKKTKSGEEYISYKPDYYGLADWFKKKYFMISNNGNDYIYDGKKYKSIVDVEFNSLIIEETFRTYTHNNLEPAKKIIRAECFDRNFYFENSNFLNMNNGVLDIKNKKLLPHDHSYKFHYCLPHNYDPDAKCEKFKNFLFDIMLGREDLVKTIQEFMGYTIYGGKPFLHKAACLYGTGRNGKSTLLEVISEMIGKENCSFVPLQKLSTPFTPVMLDGKLANIVEESPNSKIDSDIFKNVTSGGMITASHKGRPEYSFPCNARFWFACNDLPKFGDSSVGANERLIFIPFERYISQDERDHKLLFELICEIPGIINFAIEGLERLNAQGYITEGESVKLLHDEYKKDSDSVYSYFCERIMITNDDADHVKTSNLYSDYRDFCSDGNIFQVNVRTFSKRFFAVLTDFCRKGDIKRDISDIKKNYMSRKNDHRYYRKMRIKSVDCKDYNYYTHS